MADKMIILLSQIPFFPPNGGGKKKERKHSLLKKCGKKGKGDKIIKKGCNDYRILSENDSH